MHVEQVADERQDHEAEARARARVVHRVALADRGELRDRRLGVDARREPTEDDGRRRPLRATGRDLGHERCPESVVGGEAEALRHHADDRMSPPIEKKLGADRARVAGEEPLPFIEPQDHDRGRAHPLVAVEQRAAEQGRHVRQPEPRRGDVGHVGREGAAALGLRDHAASAVGGQVLERRDLVAPDQVVVERGIVSVALDVLRRDHPVPVLEGRVRVVERHPSEEADRDADGDRHAEPTDDAQERVLEQHPERELGVGAERSEPARPAHVPRLLLQIVDVAELPARGPARLLAREAARHQPLRRALQVQAHLLAHVPLQAAVEHERPEPAQHGHVTLRIARSAPANRSQLSRSSASCFRPALVTE